MTKQCVKRCGRRVAPSFFFFSRISTQLAQEQHTNRKKTKNTKAEGGKPEILLDSEPEKRLACRQFKHPPPHPKLFYPIFISSSTFKFQFFFSLSTPSITIKTLYSLCCFLRLIKHQVANEKGVRNHWKEKSLFPVSLEN